MKACDTLQFCRYRYVLACTRNVLFVTLHVHNNQINSLSKATALAIIAYISRRLEVIRGKLPYIRYAYAVFYRVYIYRNFLHINKTSANEVLRTHDQSLPQSKIYIFVLCLQKLGFRQKKKENDRRFEP